MTVIIPKEVYFTIVAACVRFANKKIPRERWLEECGIFIGKNVEKKKDQDVVITAAYPIMHETYDPKAVVDRYVWSDEDYISTTMIEDEAFARNEFILGWWHSHPGFKVMLSGFGDRKTTLSYQSLNPLAIALVFNHERLLRQIELPNKQGDPVKQLKNDPGFKIFRLEDPNNEKSNTIEVEYRIEGFESPEQMILEAQKLIIDITNFFPSDNLVEFYSNYINGRINKLNSQLLGTEEYLRTLLRKGEGHRVSEVLEQQKNDIQKYVAETFLQIEKIKSFMNYLEYKERATVILAIEDILHLWDEAIAGLDEKLATLSQI
ncbi:MAG: Mov34/MPN/PAD-1 family protein [Promethearchaeota archaeon]